ncbi:unnamed protein product [Lasius platythorax]|uniref:Uncharacterized protein n=1 Tax=Lasius platythorax TaxID=488582 RepID=A0AAV2P9P1_9HYME
MGKFGKYEKKYKVSWQALPEFSGWLQRNDDSINENKEAYCNICKTGLRAQKNDLEKHSKTKLHRDNAATFMKQKKLNTCGIDIVANKNKAIDLKLAVYVATHSAIRSIDHLSDLLVQLGKKSTLCYVYTATPRADTCV